MWRVADLFSSHICQVELKHGMGCLCPCIVRYCLSTILIISVFSLACPNLEIGTHAYFMFCMGDSGTSVWRLALSQSSRRPSHARWCTIIMQDQLVQVYLGY
jgi:hypothetical protein